MTGGAGLRKLGLAVHLAVSVGWTGLVVAYLGLVLAGLGGGDPQAERSAWWALDQVIGVLAPFSVFALVSGILQGLVSPWGVLRHHWVVVKLVLTGLATVVLLLTLPEVRAGARLAAAGQPPALEGQLLHPAAGLVVLLVILGLSVFKPRGLTPAGQRHQRAHVKRPKESAREQ